MDYTVLVDGDKVLQPSGDVTRSSLNGAQTWLCGPSIGPGRLLHEMLSARTIRGDQSVETTPRLRSAVDSAVGRPAA